MEKEFTKIEQAAALRIHERANKEAEEYVAHRGGNIIELVACGRGYKAGYMRGSQEMFDLVDAWLKAHINDYFVKGRDIDLMFEDLKCSMEK